MFKQDTYEIAGLIVDRKWQMIWAWPTQEYGAMIVI